MFRRRKITKKAGEGENPFLLTFSDFMASLLAIFILVLIVTLIELEKKKDAISVTRAKVIESLKGIQSIQATIARSLKGVSEREHALAGMLAGIQEKLKERGIEVVLAENGTVLRIPEQQLQFASGDYRIQPAYFGSVNAIGQALLQALSKGENQTLLDTVFVEGHTDSQPKSGEFGNRGLSTERAIWIWNFWTDKPGELSALKALRTLPTDLKIAAKPLISVSGYADTRSTHGLLDGQTLKNDRPEDRRIDIRFTLVSSEKQSLEGLQENVEQMLKDTDVLIQQLETSGHAP